MQNRAEYVFPNRTPRHANRIPSPDTLADEGKIEREKVAAALAEAGYEATPQG